MALAIAAWQQAIARETFFNHMRDQARLTRELSRILRGAAHEAENIVARLAQYDDVGHAIRSAQFAQSALALREVEEALWQGVQSLTIEGMGRSSLIAAKGLEQIAKVLERAVGDSDLAGSFLAAARHSVLNVRSRILNEIDLSPAVFRNEALMTNKVGEAINRALALNKSAKEIAKDVAQFIDPSTPGGTSFAAMRLGRTELNNAFHHTSVQSAAAQPWVTGVQWNLSGSHPRPDVCNDLADRDADDLGRGIYWPQNVPDKPHPQCFCFTTTVTEPVEKFLDKLTSGAYDSWMGSPIL